MTTPEITPVRQEAVRTARFSGKIVGPERPQLRSTFRPRILKERAGLDSDNTGLDIGLGFHGHLLSLRILSLYTLAVP